MRRSAENRFHRVVWSILRSVMTTEIKLTRAQRRKLERERYKARSDSQIYEDRVRRHPEGTKRCGGPCRQYKPLDNFWNNRRECDGLDSRCKTCVTSEQKRLATKRVERSAEQIADDVKRLRPSGDKKCLGYCGMTKPFAEFEMSKRTADGYRSICKKCHSMEKKLTTARFAAMRDEARRPGCVICGLQDVRCIDLAHRNREDKLRHEKGRTVNPTQIRDTTILINELKLVEPKCANCHAIATHEENQRNQYSSAREEKRRLPVNLEKTKRGVCIDCKLQVQDRFWMFDFDHVRGKKVEGIAKMVMRGKFTDAEILLEMTKCDLRCKNCHRIATHERRQNKTK